MSWQQKILEVLALLPEHGELAIVFDAPGSGAPSWFVSKVEQEFKLASNDYLAFLQAYDGLQVDMFTVFGSPESGFPGLLSRIEAWRGILDLARFLPVSEGAAGDIFCLSRDGSVCLVAVDPPYTVTRVCSSFSELLDDFFMGSHFLDLFPLGRSDSEWLDFLRERGWLPA